MINYILLILTALSFILLIIGIIYMNKLKRFEDERILTTKNILTFGLFFLLLNLGISSLTILDKLFQSTLIKISPNIPNYIQTLDQISNTAFIPLFAICLLAAMISLKEL